MDREITAVLIADHLPQVRASLRLLLSQAEGLAVAGEAASVASAVRLAAERLPDLVLLEWGLPGRSDSSVVGRLRAIRPEMAVIALSANPDARREALDAGADRFVSKLDPPERLLAAMHDCVLERHNSPVVQTVVE